jgi:hypothetical protein
MADVLTRRQIIRRSAIAGAAAWTAPVIIDSLASPVAAQTIPPGLCGCTFRNVNSNCSNTNSCEADDCLPSFPPAPQCEEPARCNLELIQCFTIQCNVPNTNDITITYTCGPECTPAIPNARTPGNNCAFPAVQGPTSWTFTAAQNAIQIRIGLACPPCPA